MPTYKEIKEQCLRGGKLFEDPDFPADGSSLFQTELKTFQWKRPAVSSLCGLICIAIDRPLIRTISNDDISATPHPIHSVFGSRVGFSGSADRTALFPVWPKMQ